MGLLSWFRGTPKSESNSNQSSNSNPKSEISAPGIPGMNGAVEVPRPVKNVTVFEFGLVDTSADKVTLAGYCPVSEELEPCRWEILPASEPGAPQFRVVF